MGDHMTVSSLRRTSFFAVTALLLTLAPASAHHVMGGGLPSTFAEGLLSGLGHPVIGPDHLAFLIAIGVAVGVGGLSLALPIVFVAASAIGVALHVNAVELPGAELIVAASVIVAGFLLARGRAMPLAAGRLCSVSPVLHTAMPMASRSSAPSRRRSGPISSASSPSRVRSRSVSP